MLKMKPRGALLEQAGSIDLPRKSPGIDAAKI